MHRFSAAFFIALFGLTPAMTAQTNEELHTIVDDAWVGAQGFHFSGRLTEMRRAPAKEAGRWSAFYRTTRMLFTSGEEGVVTWRVGQFEWTVRADDHGYWELAANTPLGLAPGWHAIEAVPTASSPAYLLVPDPCNTLGIISDIDDTILVSDVLSKRRLLSNSLLLPAERRGAVPGLATLYRSIAARNAAPETTPVFYVSGSPRQLTDNLRLFMTMGGFPRGVLQLKEISTERGDSLLDTPTYKRKHIETILAAFPGVKFLLIGDDGEQDPEIFAHAAEKYPDRIEGRLDPSRAHRSAAREVCRPARPGGIVARGESGMSAPSGCRRRIAHSHTQHGWCEVLYSRAGDIAPARWGQRALPRRRFLIRARLVS